MLIGVFLRFRVNSAAVPAYVKQMFHQALVSPEDRGTLCYLCYLWWPDGDLTKDPNRYQRWYISSVPPHHPVSVAIP